VKRPEQCRINKKGLSIELLRKQSVKEKDQHVMRINARVTTGTERLELSPELETCCLPNIVVANNNGLLKDPYDGARGSSILGGPTGHRKLKGRHSQPRHLRATRL